LVGRDSVEPDVAKRSAGSTESRPTKKDIHGVGRGA